jgi:hypothetical protein
MMVILLIESNMFLAQFSCFIMFPCFKRNVFFLSHEGSPVMLQPSWIINNVQGTLPQFPVQLPKRLTNRLLDEELGKVSGTIGVIDFLVGP